MYLIREKDQVGFFQRGVMRDGFRPWIKRYPGLAREYEGGGPGMEFMVCGEVNNAPRFMRLFDRLVYQCWSAIPRILQRIAQIQHPNHCM